MSALDDALEYLKELNGDPIDQCGIYAAIELAQLREHIRILREALQGMIDLCIVEEKYEISEIETAKSALEVTK